MWSAVERFSVAGISFLFGLVLARLLSPSDYGVIAMLNIFMAISQTFIDSGFSSALIRKPDRTAADNATAFYFNIVVGLACYLLLFAAAPFIARFYDTTLLVPVTRVIGLNLLLNSLCVVQQALLTVRIDFKTQAKISLTATIVSGGVGILLAYSGFGVWALVVQSVSAAFLRMLLLWLLAKWASASSLFKNFFPRVVLLWIEAIGIRFARHRLQQSLYHCHRQKVYGCFVGGLCPGLPVGAISG